MCSAIDETLLQLFRSIVKDFQSQLEGPFHRGGARGLTFSVIPSRREDSVCGFRIVTGGSEWQEKVSSIRTVSDMGVKELNLTGDDKDYPEISKVHCIWMDVETLEGIHRIAKQYIEQAEISRDRSGSIRGEFELFDQFLEKALSYYRKQSKGLIGTTDAGQIA